MSGPDTSLQGTTAIVTGASSGIGEATALALAARGARVALVARRADRLDALAARLRDEGAEALTFTADLADAGAAEDVIERAAADLGRLDILVNNAGLMLLGPIVDADPDEWHRMIDVNLVGLMRCTRAALPHLLRAAGDGPRGVADLVNVSSVAGRVARSGSGAYNASKHAVGAFSESLRQEVTARQVRVSLVEPGAVATELAGHNRPEILDTIKQRFGGIERLEAPDIAEAIAFIVTRPSRMAINELLVRPTGQEG